MFVVLNVCVRERVSAYACVSVCVRVCERERERECLCLYLSVFVGV